MCRRRALLQTMLTVSVIVAVRKRTTTSGGSCLIRTRAGSTTTMPPRRRRCGIDLRTATSFLSPNCRYPSPYPLLHAKLIQVYRQEFISFEKKFQPKYFESRTLLVCIHVLSQEFIEILFLLLVFSHKALH